MLTLLYDFFYNKIFAYTSVNSVPYAYYAKFFNDTEINMFNQTFGMRDYLSWLCSLVCLGFIIVLCILFIYKIIKLIGGLIR